MDPDLIIARVQEVRRAVPAADADVLEAALVKQSAEVHALRDSEKTLVKALRRVQNEVLGERLKADRLREAYENEQKDLAVVDEERARLQRVLDDFEQKETVSKYETAELERTHGELALAAEALQRDNEALVRPDLAKLDAVLAQAREQFRRTEETLTRDAARKRVLLDRFEQLAVEKLSAAACLHSAKDALQKVAIEPERIRKQSESVQKAIEKMESEISRVTTRSRALDKTITKQSCKRAEADDVRSNLRHKLELHRDTIAHRQRDVDAVGRNVAVEKARTHQLGEAKFRLELARKAVDSDARHEADVRSLAKKELESLRRKCRKKKAAALAAQDLLPMLQAQVADSEHLLRSIEAENAKTGNEIEKSRQDVDLAIARLLRQEGVEKSKRQALEALLTDVGSMEDAIAEWTAEERRQNKLLSVLAAQREMKAREAARADTAEKETQEEVKVKELILLDLSKKSNEVSNRLKEFSALYDVVKNERNKYVNFIQASSQALAEMKEKIKILMNEVEILRNESLAKDKALAKEGAQHAAAQAQRDGLRLDLYRSQAEYRKKQEVVEQQIVELDKLNGILNGLERAMLRLQAAYAKAVEQRNGTGINLIDRNDELCILYEKVNLQEFTIKSGDVGVRQRTEDARALRLKLAEVQRHVAVARKQLPQLPLLAKAVVDCKAELRLARASTEQLCSDLESPANLTRWRTLPGDDADRDALAAKTAVLEERLNAKKEALLENELVLEEVANLAAKLQHRAASGRGETLDLARQVNGYQAKIRDATRRMMAVVSELSMYQATAMKLQQQKRDVTTRLEEAKWHAAQDAAPTEDAARELERRLLERSQPRGLQAAPQAQPDAPGTVRTTAEPRPNAYIPDAAAGLGIPKPYGNLAPFKPTVPGATSRHIRVPVPPVIVI